jgi:hypothetical protein
MTDLAGMPSYFWLVSPRLKTPVGDEVPYTTAALRQDLLRVRTAWEDCQANRERDAIYTYLSAVFDLVAWWTAEGRALERAQNGASSTSAHLITTSRSPRSFCAPRIVKKLTSEHDRNGHARFGMQRSTRQMPNRLQPSFGGKAASTNVRSDLRVTLGDGSAAIKRREGSRWPPIFLRLPSPPHKPGSWTEASPA